MNHLIAKVMFFLTGGQSGFAFQLSHSWHGVDLYFPLVIAGMVACFGAVAFLGVGMSRWYTAKRKTATIAFVAALALTTAAYAASSTLAALSAVSSVSGTDLFYDVQSGSDFKATAAQISTYVLSQATISAGCQTTVTNSGTPPLTIGTQELTIIRTSGNYATTDCGHLVQYNSASNQSPTLPSAASIGNGGYFDTCSIQHAQTITPNSGIPDTIGGATSYPLGTGVAATPNCVRLVSDGTSDWKPIPYNNGIIPTTTQSGTTYTLAAADCGSWINFTSNSAVTVTIPATLATGCSIAMLQAGTAKVSVNGPAVTPATLETFGGTATGTAGQWAAIGITIEANVGGSSAVAVLQGSSS